MLSRWSCRAGRSSGVWPLVARIDLTPTLLVHVGMSDACRVGNTQREGTGCDGDVSP